MMGKDDGEPHGEGYQDRPDHGQFLQNFNSSLYFSSHFETFLKFVTFKDIRIKTFNYKLSLELQSLINYIFEEPKHKTRPWNLNVLMMMICWFKLNHYFVL